MESRQILFVRDNTHMIEEFKHADNYNLPDSINACVTSPPYQRDMGFEWWNITKVADALVKILDGPLWLNFGDLVGNMSKGPRVAITFEDSGFSWRQTIIWEKNHYTPTRSKRMFDQRHEYIYLLLPKSLSRYEIDRLAIGIPYADKSNIRRFGHKADLKCPGTVWKIPYETIHSKDQKKHRHRFPIALPIRCLKASNLSPGDWVIDPYVGSGTTMAAAKILGLNCIGYENNEEHVETIVERLDHEIEVYR